jgi:hypothetical protein
MFLLAVLQSHCVILGEHVGGLDKTRELQQKNVLVGMLGKEEDEL